MTSVRRFKPEVREHILWLHQEAFNLPPEENPCIPCKGGCCRSCRRAHGYLDDANFQRLTKKYTFDGKLNGKGFLTDTGCALPPEERSIVCLGFICSGFFHDPSKTWEQSGWYGPPKPRIMYPEKIDIPFNLKTIALAEEIRRLGWDY